MNLLDVSKTGGAYVFQNSLGFVQNAFRVGFAAIGQALALGDYANMVIIWGCERSYAAGNIIIAPGAVFYEQEIWEVAPAIIPSVSSSAPVYATKVLADDIDLDPSPFATGGAKNIHNNRYMVWSLTPPSIPADDVELTDSKRFQARIQSVSVPVGTILPFAGGMLPTGYALCDGASLDAVSDTTLIALFNTIGTTYGGTGISSFNLPDTRGRVLVGAGGILSLGQTFGADSITLSTAQLPAHSHTGTTNSDGAHSHTVGAKTGGTGSGSFADTTGGGTNNNLSTSTDGAHVHSFTTDNTGSGDPIDIRQKSLAVNMMIRIR